MSNTLIGQDRIKYSTYYVTSSYEFYRAVGIVINAFTATINGTPSGSTLVYNAPSAGNEEDLEQYDGSGSVATDNLAKMVLHNTTRSEDLLISSVNKTTNTITFTSAVPGTWANGDTITTLRPSGGFQFRALEILDTSVIPANATHVLLSLQLTDTAAANKAFWIGTDKASIATSEITIPCNVQVVSQYDEAPLFIIPITNRRIMMHHRGTLGTIVLRVAGYVK